MTSPALVFMNSSKYLALPKKETCSWVASSNEAIPVKICLLAGGLTSLTIVPSMIRAICLADKVIFVTWFG